MSDVTPRVMPHSEEAEVALLGSVLVDNYALSNQTVSRVQVKDFYREGHRKIWACLPTLREKRGEDGKPGPIDLTTLVEELRRRGQLDAASGMTYLIGLEERTPTAAYAEHYARIVLEKAHLRNLISVSSKLMQHAYDQDMPLEDIDLLATRFPQFELLRDEAIPVGQDIQSVLTQAESGTGPQGAPTGLTWRPGTRSPVRPGGPARLREDCPGLPGGRARRADLGPRTGLQPGNAHRGDFRPHPVQ